jgi:hypothetical protein
MYYLDKYLLYHNKEKEFRVLQNQNLWDSKIKKLTAFLFKNSIYLQHCLH